MKNKEKIVKIILCLICFIAIGVIVYLAYFASAVKKHREESQEVVLAAIEKAKHMAEEERYALAVRTLNDISDALKDADSEELSDEVQKLSEEYSEIRELLDDGYDYLQKGKYEEARKCYEKVLKYDDDCGKAFLGVAKSMIIGRVCTVEMYNDTIDYIDKCLKKTDYIKLETLKSELSYCEKDISEDSMYRVTFVMDGDIVYGDYEIVMSPATVTDDDEISLFDDKGKVLNIYSYNSDFQDLVERHYPNYEKSSSSKEGKIGDIKVVWHTVLDGSYNMENYLNEINKYSDSEDAMDIVIANEEMIKSFAEGDLLETLDSIGISNEDLENQYKYTLQLASDEKGNYRGVSYNVDAAVLIYNTKIAEEVFGSSDPDFIQNKVKDLKTFNETAKSVEAAGFKMTATAADTFFWYSDGKSTKWVDDYKISVPSELKAWADDAKKMYDAEGTTVDGKWSDTWINGFKEDVFCYNAPMWMIRYTIDMYCDGGWKAVEGPSASYYGGDWICVGRNTDNPGVCEDIIRSLVIDTGYSEKILDDRRESVNNSYVMSTADYELDILDGQSPYSIVDIVASKINEENFTKYDPTLNTLFQDAMLSYIDGTSTYENALKSFYESAELKFPELSR